MSRQEITSARRIAFIARFVEMCGTAEPARIQRLFNISYQSAKNYLHGRLPSTDLLLAISEQTPYSIDWLLTGRGKKFVHDLQPQDTQIPADQMETFVRRICVEVINEISGRQEAAQPKIVKLQSSDLMSEKVVAEAAAPSGRKG